MSEDEKASPRGNPACRGVWIWGVQNTGSPTPPILQVEEERRSAAGSEKEEERMAYRSGRKGILGRAIQGVRG